MSVLEGDLEEQELIVQAATRRCPCCSGSGQLTRPPRRLARAALRILLWSLS